MQATPKHPGSLRALWPFLRPYRTVGLLALLSLGLASAFSLALPAVLQGLIDAGVAAQDPGERLLQLRTHFFWLFAAGAGLAVFAALRFYFVAWLGERVTADLRSAVFARVIEQDPAFFEQTRTGEVTSRLTADTTLVQTVVGSSASMGLRNAVLFVGSVLVLLVRHPVLTAIVLLGLAALVVPSVLLGRRVRRLSRSSQDRLADTSALASELIQGVTQVQIDGQTARESGRFREAALQALEVALRRSRVRAVFILLVMLAVTGALSLGLYAGTQAVLQGRISAGELGASVLYVGMMAMASAVLAEVWGELLRAAGATERLMELLHARPSIEDPAHAKVWVGSSGGCTLQIESASLRYPTRPEQLALRSIDLQIGAGETIALVGPSGAGKSTLLQLLLRLRDPDSGRILINGIDLRDLRLAELRQHIALVPQEPVLFSGSVRDNIAYARPHATPAEIEAAARAAQAHDFICDLPQAYDSEIGERGLRLSGGQKQRVAIARAMLKDAPLLLLDEATSALDSQSELAVQRALDAARVGRTTLVIAHRLSTVQKADRIVVLDQGTIVESGTHAELLAQGGLYARLAQIQFNRT